MALSPMIFVQLTLVSRLFDADESGSMDFGEYLLAVNSTSQDSPEEKLVWVFHVFDRFIPDLILKTMLI